MTHQDIKAALDAAIKADANPKISGPTLNEVLTDILDYALNSRVIKHADNLIGADTYTHPILENRHVRNLMIIIEGVVISASDEWQNLEGNYESEPGVIRFPAPMAGYMEILITPDAI